MKTKLIVPPPVRSLARALATGLLPALFAVNAVAQSVSPAVTNLWRIPPGREYDFLAAADGLVRGAAINPVTGNIIYASRAGGSNHLAVVDPATSGVSNRLSGATVSGGTLALDQVKVADDGVVYAANLAAATSTLRLYRWDSDSTTDDPLVALEVFGVSTRYGDTMDLRGSGVNTEIIIAGSGGNKFALLTTTDGTNFTMTEFNLPVGLAAGDIGKGIAFDGAADAFYAKRDATTATANMRYVTFDRLGVTSTLVTSFPVDGRLVGLDIATTNGNKIAAGVLYSSGTTLQADQHRVRFWDITSHAAPQLIGDDPMPGPYFANANAIGAADAKLGRFVVVEPNNVIALYQLYLVTNPPPTITSQPVGSTNILTGGYFRLAVAASGSGLKYQWKLNDVSIANATNSALNLTNLTAADAGFYHVTITNAGGFAISSNAEIALLSSVLTTKSARLWQLVPGSRSYLTTDNSQRGLAFNAPSNHLVLVNRAGAPSIHVLDASTGADIRTLDLTGVGGQLGETFPINVAGVADDGAVYVCNLGNTATGAGFTIYRWADDAASTLASIAYGPDSPVGLRIGDTLAVSGSGVNTRLIASTRSGTQVVIFTTSDGQFFSPNVVDVTGATAGFAGLGLAAGEGDTFWATSSGFPLVKVFYDLANGTNEIQLSLGGQTGFNIGVDSQNGLVADTGTQDTPSNLRLLDVFEQTIEAVLIDQEFFGADNDNGNGTGTVAFDVTGGRIFALDTNNGLLALKYGPRLKQNGNVLTWTGPGTLEGSTNVVGTYVDIPAAPSPHAIGAGEGPFFRVRR